MRRYIGGYNDVPNSFGSWRCTISYRVRGSNFDTEIGPLSCGSLIDILQLIGTESQTRHSLHSTKFPAASLKEKCFAELAKFDFSSSLDQMTKY